MEYWLLQYMRKKIGFRDYIFLCNEILEWVKQT